jgi:hypothetical protein
MNFIPKIEYTERITSTLKTVTFSSPPEGDPFGESVEDNVRITKTNDGTRQTQFNYTEAKLDIEFIFQTQAVYDAFKLFIKEHARYGRTFKYYPSSDEVEFEEYYLDVKKVSYKKPIPSATLGEFEHDFKFRLSRVD